MNSTQDRIDEYPTIRSVSTHLVKYGELECSAKPQLALVIPGNNIHDIDDFYNNIDHNNIDTEWRFVNNEMILFAFC